MPPATDNIHSSKDPSQNFMVQHPSPLDAFFKPKSVAVVGAKDDVGSVGRTMLVNLLSGGFKGEIFAINPKRSEVLGLPCYPSLSAVTKPIDLLIIITPAATVPAIVEEGVRLGITAAIIISAGFKEAGEQGIALENKILEIARTGGMRIIGPNCLGIMNPIDGLNATFAKGMALPGNIAFISQSGAMCTAVLDWSFQERIGFSSFVSIGSMADVDWGDLISYLGSQPTTQSILIYMESIGNPRSFLSAAREIALEKPIIVIKAGRSEQAAHAAASHTGSLAGSDAVLQAALERVGVLRVNTISELFSMAAVLARQPRPKGPNLTIITNAGGPAVLATDATALNGAELTKLSPKTIQALDAFLPPAWSHSNPVDLLGDARPDRYGKSIDVIMKDDASNGILVVLSPQDVTDPAGTAECLRPYAQGFQKPILASWMGGASVQKGVEILNHVGIPTFEYPDDAAWTFAMMWKYSHNLKALYEVPAIGEEEITDAARREVRNILKAVRKENRTILTEFESKRILELYDIPVVETFVVHSPEEAAEKANKIGFPIVLKLFSHTITHKTDVGGVVLNLRNAEEVKDAYKQIEKSVSEIAGKEHFEGVTVQKMISRDGYELILGSSTDPQFGPVILFGTGGQLVEVYKDTALALPPLNTNLAKRLISETRVSEALRGVRGRPPVDMGALEQILVRFSQLIVEHPSILECDINPLMISDKQLISLDARFVLSDGHISEDSVSPCAIRPYPLEYVTKGKLRDGTDVIVRPIRPEDEPAMVIFHRELSENSVRQRYFEFVSLDKRVAHERLVRICFNDYDREIAFVAENARHRQGATPVIMGLARLSRTAQPHEAELTMMIADAYHRKGLGNLLMKNLIDCAKKEGILQLSALILNENEGMIHLCKKYGFVQRPYPDPALVLMVCELGNDD